MSELVIAGSIANRSIDAATMQQLKGQSSTSGFWAVFDRLMDWVTQSNLSAAKTLANKVFHDSDPSVQIKSFLSMRNLAHPHSRADFKICSRPEHNTVELCFVPLGISVLVTVQDDTQAGSLMMHLEKIMSTESESKVVTQLQGDIDRSRYIVEAGGERAEYTKSDKISKEEKMERMQQLSCHESVRDQLSYLSCQMLPIALGVWSNQHPEFSDGHLLFVPNSEQADIHWYIVDYGDGHLWVEYFAHGQETDLDQLEELRAANMYPDLMLHLGFSVGPERVVCCFFDKKGQSEIIGG